MGGSSSAGALTHGCDINRPARGACYRQVLSPDIALQILPRHEPEPDLQIGEVESEAVRDSVQLVCVGEVVLLDPPVVAAAGDSERTVHLLVRNATIQQVAEQRP